FVCFCQ
ncbi:putative ABC transporter ATP-binding protein, partial [Haemophilus influenzae]